MCYICIGWPFFLPKAKDVAEKVFKIVLPEVVTKDEATRKRNEQKLKDYPNLKKKAEEAEKEVEKLTKAPGRGDPPSPDNV